MKRIIKRGELFYIQTKILWWWSYEEDYTDDWHGGGSRSPISFNSLKYAKNHLSCKTEEVVYITT